MNIDKCKSKLSTIALILMLAIAYTLVVIPAATAQEIRVNSWPYCNAMPNPQQVNQPTLIHVGSEWPTPNVNYAWENLMVELTKPDGEIEMLGPYSTDSTGGTGAVFTPTQVGKYYLRTYFPEQVNPDVPSGFFEATAPPGAILEEAWSPVVELVVQEEPITHFPTPSLPDEYWTRPIDAQTWSWSSISGNWLGDQVSMDASPPAQTLYADYNDYAPETGHVLWAKPITMGGLAGGQMGNQGFEQGDAYEPKWTGSVIIGGKLFYNQFETTGGLNLEQTVVAVDLHTGEELWNKPLTTPDGDFHTLAFGQVYYFGGYNLHGVFDFLWATTSGGWGQPTNWHAFDPISGRWVYTMEGPPSGTRVYGPNGEIFIYTVNLNAGWMTLWSTLKVVTNIGSGDVGQGSFNPQGRVYDAEDVAEGIEWNVTIPTGLPGSVDKVREGIILGVDFDKYSLSYDTLAMWAISTEPGQEGTLLYNKTWSTPLQVGHYDVQDASAEDDVFCVSVKETRSHYGFRLSTGEELWGPSEQQHYTDIWGYASSNSWDNIYDGKYISGNYGGVVWCRDVTTGQTLWTYDVTDYYAENLHNNKWRFRPAFFAGGKLYIENTEHNPFDPQHRGAPFACIDLETGQEIFRIPYRGSEWSSTPIIGDSIIATYNNYDQRIYAIGKGPSATTVEAPLTAIPLGTSATIRGTVMDVSPGTEDAVLRLRFPNGVPAMADEHMTDWMLYVYNQFDRPKDATGVEVKLEAIDPNNNYQDYGTTTTDSYGNYGFNFEPEVPGQYMIIATFGGSESYYGSTTTTYVSADPAPEDPDVDVPTADEIAQATVNRLPAYPEVPDVPSAEEVAQETINRLPAYPEMPEMPDIPETPAYLTIDLAIIAAVVIAIIIGLYGIVKKQK
jgi:hypothetical protein